MTDKKLKVLAIGIASVVTPVIVNVLFDNVKAEAMGHIGRTARSLSRTVSSSVRSVRPTNGSTSTNRVRLFSTTDKVLGVVGVSVAAVGVVGTAVGLSLTEDQYQQNKRSFDDVVDRAYSSFYEDREKQLKELYDKWGVPMPDKYKNPLNKENASSNLSPGFSFGEGK